MARKCSVANALAIVGERWSLLAVREVFLGTHRFDQIVENTGASRDILASRLRSLVEAGVLEKRQYEQRPPRYEYVLTESGRALHPVLLALRQWGDEHAPTDTSASRWQHVCGAVLTPRMICTDCGQPTRSEDITLTPAAVPG
jgi:DNA-binding HxlR family transcriptional regulator